VKLSPRKDRSDELAGGKQSKGRGKVKGSKEASISAALAAGGESDSDEDEDDPTKKRARSAIVFVGSCARCQEVTQILLELGVDAVCIHSLLDQRRRLAALGKFKSLHNRLLIATDVASRGLDLPDVDLVKANTHPFLLLHLPHAPLWCF
jgi:superfamily II DNA/RNA helicase